MHPKDLWCLVLRVLPKLLGVPCGVSLEACRLGSVW
jgi:hypothetical protein